MAIVGCANSTEKGTGNTAKTEEMNPTDAVQSSTSSSADDKSSESSDASSDNGGSVDEGQYEDPFAEE